MKQTYKYYINKSILNDDRHDLQIGHHIECLLFRFYIINTPCANISRRSKSFSDYGWPGRIDVESGLKEALKRVLDLSSDRYIFTEKDNMADKFKLVDLTDNQLSQIDTERCVVGKTSGNNNYIKLLRHIRNCLSHGKYIVLRNTLNDTMLIMQDDDKNNVTARIVIKLNTLVGMITIIDKYNSLDWKKVINEGM